MAALTLDQIVSLSLWQLRKTSDENFVLLPSLGSDQIFFVVVVIVNRIRKMFKILAAVVGITKLIGRSASNRPTLAG